MGPEKPLPHSDAFASAEQYVESLLGFVTTNHLLRTLCGGVHILDFLTATPDLYSRVIDSEWQDFFRQHDIMPILDLLMREDLDQYSSCKARPETWRDGPAPPSSLLQYIRDVRRHSLKREPVGNQCSRNRALKPTQKLARHVAVGMNVKKVHEVGLFAHYVDKLTRDIAESTGKEITHLVDFGSGQNYLGRALASQPYGQNVVAVESKHHNIQGAKDFDVTAKLTKKEKLMRNKKIFRSGLEREGASQRLVSDALPTPPSEPDCEDCPAPADGTLPDEKKTTVQISAQGHGTVQYIEHSIQDGDLSSVVDQIVGPSGAITSDHQDNTSDFSTSTFTSAYPTKASSDEDLNLMTISLHSCGNLVHHGLRSLTLNPSVRAVALVGCCYNLLTERLQPATYKLPALRLSAHPRLERTGMAGDAHGFPMSERFCAYRPIPKQTCEHQHSGHEGTREEVEDTDSCGVNLNITSRMMAVQAPQNWGHTDSENFFRRHFFRALLQRILLDRKVISPPLASASAASKTHPCPTSTSGSSAAVSPSGHSSDTPIVIGSLRKACYDNFLAYVRGALEKLFADPERGQLFRDHLADMSDAEIEEYEVAYAGKKKELSVVWSLMAFSAGVVEAAIVVDRWLWLREQETVDKEMCWVEAVFDYGFSPRNLVVVGVKK